jgi:hypothetical protein
VCAAVGVAVLRLVSKAMAWCSDWCSLRRRWVMASPWQQGGEALRSSSLLFLREEGEELRAHSCPWELVGPYL